MSLTWDDRIAALRRGLGREPTASEYVEAAAVHDMTPTEIGTLASSPPFLATLQASRGRSD